MRRGCMGTLVAARVSRLEMNKQGVMSDVSLPSLSPAH
jgi:hypothetical protein